MSETSGGQEQEIHKRVLSDMFDRYRELGRSSARSEWRRGRPRTKSTDADLAQPEPDEVGDAEVSKGAEEGWKALDGEFGAGAGIWRPSPGMHRSKAGTGPSRFDPKPVGDILKVERDKRGWNRSISIGTIVGQWESIVGEVVAQHCPVESFEEGKLVVQADSTAWAQQLQLLLPQVQRRIDEEVGSGVVEQVIVRGPKAPSWKRGPRSVPGRGPRDTYG